MFVGAIGCHSPSWRPQQKTAMNQVGFHDILERPLILANRSGEGFQADGTPSELLDQRGQNGSIEAIETRLIDVESSERIACRIQSNALPGAIAHRRKISHTAEQSIRDARRSPCAAGDFVRRLGLDLEPEETARSRDDLFEIIDGVVLEPSRPAETVAQR